jgi:hypothetical protein
VADRGDDGAAPDGALEIDASLLDPSSGLFAQPFFLAALSWRVIACRRVLRPLAFAQLEVVDGLPDGPAVASDPQVISAMIRATLRTSDVGARLADGTYGLMLEDTPEDGAVWAVERLRRSLATRPGGRVLRAGVACELVRACSVRLRRARCPSPYPYPSASLAHSASSASIALPGHLTAPGVMLSLATKPCIGTPSTSISDPLAS